MTDQKVDLYTEPINLKSAFYLLHRSRFAQVRLSGLSFFVLSESKGLQKLSLIRVKVNMPYPERDKTGI
ncbi:hypothetical protein [Photorhabdus aegyptia]|uniref:hypothetical protein n=1 Tax=Photorhabdus aegyptia TaxID=2805098 RepID=UPI001E2A9415|nr:hypothetical protein [Photorhabdus aegyptia]MCC8457352.1 hypothetical protein [Photorhabdus aegyptia]